MKVGKSFTTLLALGLLLGLGVWTSADAQAGSISNEEIVVTAPVAETILNIASNDVVVEVDFSAFNATAKAYTVFIGLASRADTDAEVTTLNAAATGRILDDASDTGGTAADFAGVLAVVSAATTLPGDNLAATGAHTKAGETGRVLGSVTIPFFSRPVSGTDFEGNITAAEIEETSLDNVRLTVTLEVGSDAGTEENIVAFAIVQNTTDGQNSDLVISDIAGAFDGDWDGPEIGELTLSSFTERLDADGDATTDPDIVNGSTHAPIAPGDRITVDVQADGATQQAFFVDRIIGIDVTLAGGDDITTLTMDPLVRSPDGSAARQTYIVQEHDDPDDDGIGPDVTDKVRVIATVTSVDENGNPAADETGLTDATNDAAIVVTGNTAEATFSGAATGVETALDTNPPTLAIAASAGVLPATGGTISDGGQNDTADGTIPADGFGNAAIDIDDDDVDDIEAVENAGLLQYEGEEAWKTFTINFDNGEEDGSDGEVNTTLTLTNANNSLLNAAFGDPTADVIHFVDFSDPTAIVVTDDFDADGDRDPTGGDGFTLTFSGATTTGAANGGSADIPLGSYAVPTGSYTVTYQVTDLADNASNELEAEDVWVDVDDFEFASLAPPDTETTINENTADHAYELGEAVSVLELTIATADAASALLDTEAPHTVYAAGSFLSDTESEHILPVTDLLVDNAVYSFTFRIRDVAGNWNTIVNAPDRTYDVDFDEAVIAKFDITLDAVDLLAGADNGATIQAQADDDRGAGTYERTATLTLDCADIQADTCADCDAKAFPDCSGVTITGEGVAATGDNTWSLDADGWNSIGARDIEIVNETATIEFTLTVDDDVDTFTGDSDAVTYMPEVYDTINLWAGDASAGSRFAVNVEATDEFGNIRWEDERLINLSANRPANLPGTVLLDMGLGTVWATASAGPLEILASDPIALDGAPTVNGENFLVGDLSVDVASGGGPGAPDQVVGYDYKGADGEGDQGGFIVLSFTGAEGATGYRISREVTVFDAINDEGDLEVNLDGDGELAFIPWGTVAASGDDPQRVVVATLDNKASKWGVAGMNTAEAVAVAKQAFDGELAVSSPYELMTQTMVESKKLAQLGPGIPVFAELTPEALSYIDGSFAPSFKDGGVLESAMAITAEAVRAIDDIAPEPVTMIQAFDTPGDKGGSITVSWIQSESDAMLARTSNGAVGPNNSDAVMGVKGYNIYRSVNGGEQSMVGKVAPGVTSFVDNTALNGLRYNYSVVPYDDDNLATSELVGSAMSIRNVAFDSKGVAVQGLFGADSQVGFDDFFIFADHFGQLGGGTGYDPAFDLAPNNQIDFFDFFVFADNFGRVAVGASKVVPLAAGLNDNARIDLAAEALPRVGEEMVVSVSLADFVELKGYGFTVSYDPTTFEFIRVDAIDNRFGSEEISQPQVVAQGDGEVSVVAFGQTLADGELMLDLVLRPMMETENGLIEIGRGELADESLAFNQIASLGAIAVETRPEEFALRNNYPNPFNPSTTIKYQLPDAADVRLEIFNVVGQSVRTLVSEQRNAGRYEAQWDATNNNGQSLSSGIYFYRLQAGEFQEVKKMLLMK